MKRILVLLAAVVLALGLSIAMGQTNSQAGRHHANNNAATTNTNGGEVSGWANPAKGAKSGPPSNQGHLGNDQAVPTPDAGANSQGGANGTASNPNTANTNGVNGTTANGNSGGGGWGLWGLVGLFGLFGLGGRPRASATTETIRPEDRRRVA